MINNPLPFPPRFSVEHRNYMWFVLDSEFPEGVLYDWDLRHDAECDAHALNLAPNPDWVLDEYSERERNEPKLTFEQIKQRHKDDPKWVDFMQRL